MLRLLLILLFVALCLAIAIPMGIKTLKDLRQGRINTLKTLEPLVIDAFRVIGEYYNYGHYITESERLWLDNTYRPLDEQLTDLIGTKEFESWPSKDIFKRFHDAMHDSLAHKDCNNNHFIQNQLISCASYFDTVLSHPLDAQQREAVVSLEDNVLVISSAGSGKTLTTVGKVRYLIDKQGVPPEKILLITFTRKAAESLSERLGEKNLKCRTFHRLALDIIGEVTGEQPSITDKDFSAQVYHKLMKDNPSFKSAVSDYIIRARYAMKDQFDYSSVEDYMQDRKKFGIQALFNDMRGRPIFCKSDEENRICDFLGSRGIDFLYEEPYEHQVSDANHRQYRPDFSIYIRQPNGKKLRVYLEHFAVNESGHCPSFFSLDDEIAYKDGIQWKRGLHHRYGTILLETSSADFHRGEVFDKLSKSLLKLGAAFRAVNNNDISRELDKQEENILAMLTSFNFLLKSRDANLEGVRNLARGTSDSFVINSIISPFVVAYKQMERDKEEIDFTDSIIQATELCNNGHRPDYDYILVDEFQDISLDRYRFLLSLRRDRPRTKLFCVGDDWQSIYRFAGSDMALFKHFEEFFGYTKKCFMETTYRFGEPAIAKSSKFILANPEQENKTIKPFRKDAETKLDFVCTEGRSSIVKVIADISNQIPEDRQIMLLGRYSFDVNVLKNQDEFTVTENKDGAFVTYGHRRMDFLTVHKSKGLECDYIIILNCNGGTIGFPSQISDSPALRYVLSEPDPYAFSEERRIFYVGITRAKKHTWVLYDKNNPSPFVTEFITMPQPKKEIIPESELCPKCHCGRLVEIWRGKAVNGNPYTVYACSNEKYGCDYFETKFINLNQRYKRY